MTSALPGVSIVVAVRDGSRTIAACVDSLRELRYPGGSMELIVVDNGSRDGTRGILESYGSDLRLLDEPVLGAAAARNCGIRSARHPLIAITDADCVVDPDWLRHLVAPLEDQSVGVVGGRIRALPPVNAIAAFDESIHDHERAITGFWPPYAITMSWASRASVLLEQGLFDTSFLRSQDFELSLRLGFAGYRLVYAPEAVVYHHHRATLPSLAREGFQSGYWAVAVSRKHHESLVRPGRRRWSSGSPSLMRNLLRAASGSAADGCFLLFHLSRKLGMALGSVRFGYFG